MANAEHDAYGIFYTFNRKLKAPGTTPEEEWRKIKQRFLLLEEWFEDRGLYHMVGFLVSQEMPISDIRALSVDCTKSAFERRLRQEIFKRTIGEAMPNPTEREVIKESVANQLEELSYPSNQGSIRSVLLLFNLATLLQNQRSNLRFQFDSFKCARWDIEHIRSVTDDRPERHHERVRWLRNALGYLESQGAEQPLQQAIQGFLQHSQAEAANEIFDPLYNRTLEYFDEANAGSAEHGISNLTLLDEGTNRSYKNAVFAVKRQRLLELDQAGIFVPLCTRNVFLKCYSPLVDNLMFWSESDRGGYVSAITEVLANFFCGNMESP